MQAEIECLGDRSCFTEEQAGELLPIFQERLALFDVKRAAAYYLAIRGSFSATVTSFGVKGMDVEHLLKMFPPVSARLKDVPLENKNALQLIRERDRKEGLIYADPPYVKTERLYRIAGKLGRFRRFHVRLWQILSGCEGYVVLSYNDCLSEGDPGDSVMLAETEVTVQLQQYGEYARCTDKLDLTNLDMDIMRRTKLFGDAGSRSIDAVVREELAKCANVIYAGGKTSRAALTPADKLTSRELRRAVKMLRTFPLRKSGE